MTKQDDLKTFDDLMQKYLTWVIKYCSATFNRPLFLVWYTDIDENSTDKLLSYKDGMIFAALSLTSLKETILSSADNLIEYENLSLWLENFNDLEVKEYCTYDLLSITKEIDKDNLDIETIEGFTNFVNLYRDFANQDERNAHLRAFSDNELISETWDHFYDCIFWPKFNDKEKSEERERPRLVINSRELLDKLNAMIKVFDDSIKF